MPLSITLRRGPASSPFRRHLHSLCQIPNGGDLILCSGYIYEPASGYSILDDELMDAIVDGVKDHSLKTIAGKLKKSSTMDWPQYYKNFVHRLRSTGVSVDAFVAPQRNWHAKIAIRLDTSDNPVAAIVGSSNLTGPAYGEGRYGWDYECDVTIWINKPELNDHFRPVQTAETDVFENMSAILDPEVAPTC